MIRENDIVLQEFKTAPDQRLLDDVFALFRTHPNQETGAILIALTRMHLSALEEVISRLELETGQKEGLYYATIFLYTGTLERTRDFWIYSAAFAEEQLAAQHVEAQRRSRTKQLLLTLDPESRPESHLEKLFVDISNSHFGQKGIIATMMSLKTLAENTKGREIPDWTWNKQFLKKIQSITYLTLVGRQLFNIRRLKNIKKIKKLQRREIKLKKDREKLYSVSANSGSRTIFKTALRNHIDLTSIADQKANIMLSINALIITLGLPFFYTYLSGINYLIIPAIIFLMTSVVSMIFATLSTRPVKMKGITDLEKLASGKTNLFFFGNFFKMRNEDYQKAIKQVVSDRAILDASFVNDLYHLGVALGHKYRLLRICYSIFVIGLCISLCAFVVTFALYQIGI